MRIYFQVPTCLIRPQIWAHVRCKTNNNILLFYPFVQDANKSFVPCFAFVLCIMTSPVPFYMDHKPKFGYFTTAKQLKNTKHARAECAKLLLLHTKYAMFFLRSRCRRRYYELQ